MTRFEELKVCPQTVSDCLLAQFCCESTIKKLLQMEVCTETAEKTRLLWTQSFLTGEKNRFSELLSRIRCLILAELARQKVENIKPLNMEDIIEQACDSVSYVSHFRKVKTS